MSRFVALVLLALSCPPLAVAAEPAQRAPGRGAPGRPPRAAQPPGPGKETRALEPLVGTRTYTGRKTPPGVPPAPSEGKLSCRWTVEGFWVLCEGEERIGKDGPGAHQFLILLGYDLSARRYLAYAAAPGGSALTFSGALEGKRLVLESAEVPLAKGKGKARWTFDLSDPAAIRHLDERSVNGGPWVQFDEAVMQPGSGGAGER